MHIIMYDDQSETYTRIEEPGYGFYSLTDEQYAELGTVDDHYDREIRESAVRVQPRWPEIHRVKVLPQEPKPEPKMVSVKVIP